MSNFLFPSWTNNLKELLGVLGAGGGLYATVLIWVGFSPKATDVGYAPTQPIPYSHALHAGILGLDCRYCHNTVESTSHAAVPPTETCANCHPKIHPDSPKLKPLYDAKITGLPVEWNRVHDLPDYAYFNHSRHVNSGVSCVSCHGRVDQMEVVKQVQPLSMGWCLDCHRDPAPHIRPLDQVTNLGWQPPEGKTAREVGEELIALHGIETSTDCSTCHR
jgi:hypothetical protein